ncbi:MAG: eCIS core domain-containing protein, partial [Gemmatimonadota bacterium]
MKRTARRAGRSRDTARRRLAPARRAAASRPEPAVLDSAPAVVFRCACGGGCPRCRGGSPSDGDPSGLTISRPGDRWEREADRAAERALRRDAVGHSVAGRADRRPGAGAGGAEVDGQIRLRSAATDTGSPPGAAADAAGRASALGRPTAVGIETAAASIAHGGRPLAASVRTDFESRFGRDFSTVRVHDDTRAHAAAEAIEAR